MPQLKHIDAIVTCLRGAADNLRANSNYNKYFLPAIGLVFLRHTYSCLTVKENIQPNLPSTGTEMRTLKDSIVRSLFLPHMVNGEMAI